MAMLQSVSESPLLTLSKAKIWLIARKNLEQSPDKQKIGYGWIQNIPVHAFQNRSKHNFFTNKDSKSKHNWSNKNKTYLEPFPMNVITGKL